MLSSYRKTLLIALALALPLAAVWVAAVALPEPSLWYLAWIVAPPLLLLLAVIVATLLVSGRERRLRVGAPDLFLTATRQRDRSQLEQGRSARTLQRLVSRWLNGHELLVGDVVRIRTYEEIRATLDATGALEELPFLEEMRVLCGRQARVFRTVDKIYDYGKSRRMRRLERSVVLAGLFCDGSFHGDCQAACRLIWKSAWLCRDAGTAVELPAATDPMAPTHVMSEPDPALGFRCQYTELAAASQPLGRWGIGKELRPLAAGNVTFAGFAVALLTRLFNLFQSLRGGQAFPPHSMPGAPAQAGVAPLLPIGTLVKVNSAEQIARTLDAKGKHRGLWFDRDMLKHCGQTYRVHAQVERIIDSTTGRLRPMKTPCYTLDGVFYSGEFQSFNAQHEYLFWRSEWLTPIAADVTSEAESPSREAA